jgi:N-acetylmuramoyl-L-alanine amidase
MTVDPASGSAVLSLRLGRASDADFAASLSPVPPGLPAPSAALPRSDRRPVIVLDPGHGGVDPGAERAGLREADLMLSFARLLREALVRTGQFDVVLTRDADVFVSLEGRIRVARDAGADAFVSLHADALEGGGAAGATVYTLSDTASDEAAALLAQRHDRADLLAGVDLTGTDDIVAGVLMALARTETQPRTDLLAGLIAGTIRDAGLRMHARPLQSAAFSVLKAPDIPSVLVELGFLSSDRDRANLTDTEWRARMAGALVRALQDWVLADAAEAPLRRQ